MSLGFTVLLWFHVVGAIGWVGAMLVFGLLVGPTLPSLSPTSRGELVVKLIPKYVLFAQIFTVITPVFGLALALYISHGSMSVFTPNNNFSRFVDIGAFLSVGAWVIAFLFLSPAAYSVVKYTRESMNSSAPPSPELSKAYDMLKFASALGIVILLFIVACMVAAATL